jgi:hypothetical protein
MMRPGCHCLTGLPLVFVIACGSSARPSDGGPPGETTGGDDSGGDASANDASASLPETGGADSGGPMSASDATTSSSRDASMPVDAGLPTRPDSGDTGPADGSTDATKDAASRDAASDAPPSEVDGGTIASPSSFHCVNWADQRDNFVNGLLQVSGLDATTDTYATVQAKANAILSGFETQLGANAIRIPINEPTVSGAWWAAYKGLIDAAVAKGMKVIVAYWAWHNGKPDTTAAYDSMWQVVVDEYTSNNLVFFDIHNEPFGFSTTDWMNFAAAWVASFPNVPRSRIIVAGSGYDQNVPPVGADARLNGCLLSLHDYTFFFSTTMTTQGWQSTVSTGLGGDTARAIVTEWGAPMTTGVAYDGVGAGTNDQAYMAGIPNELRTLGVGSCYWPGLRIADAWSMTTMSGAASSPSLSVNNTSGLARVHWAWGL